MNPAIRVVSTARLHLGFLGPNDGPGRRFGSIGLSLDAPETRLSLRRAERAAVIGPEPERAERYLRMMERRLGLASSHALSIEAAIPAHAGLGSGTQLALSIAAGLRALHGFAPDLAGDAAALGRGNRSGIGIGLFAQGGLIVDGGKGPRPAPPPILARMPVPSAWRILLLLDPAGRGLAGVDETAAFARLAPMRETFSAELCRLTLLQALPALVEEDLSAFGQAITKMQEMLGDYFATVQGGRFASARVAAALAVLAKAGAHGVGQSSWGPSGFAFAPDHAEAERLLKVLLQDRRAAQGLDIRIARALNHGARIAREA
jgi:beta-ribofuranosylaminobenzene 5'-phosphate synthase